MPMPDRPRWTGFQRWTLICVLVPLLGLNGVFYGVFAYWIRTPDGGAGLEACLMIFAMILGAMLLGLIVLLFHGLFDHMDY